MPAVARIRADIGVPVITVETQTDILASGLGYLPATQPDSRGSGCGRCQAPRTWIATELGLASTEVLRDIPGYPQGSCADPPNDGQERYVMDAALAQLNRWALAASRPRRPPLIKISNGEYVTDKFGNALGGVRTPAVDAPIATLTGTGNTGSSLLCFLLGTTTPLTAAQLATLYPLHSDYSAAVEQSAARDVGPGSCSRRRPANRRRRGRLAVGLPPPTG